MVPSGQEGNTQGCKFTEFSSTENMETQLTDTLPLSNLQFFGCMQEDTSWDNILRQSIANWV